MLNVNDALGFSLAGGIQQAVAAMLAARSPQNFISIVGRDGLLSLKDQLASSSSLNKLPHGISPDSENFFLTSQLVGLAATPNSKLGGFLDNTLLAVANIPAGINRILTGIVGLRGASDTAVVKPSLDQVVTNVAGMVIGQPAQGSAPVSVPGFADLLGNPVTFVKRQFSVALSLVITIGNLTDPALPDNILKAYESYFLSPDGFATVENVRVIAPMHTSGIISQIGDLRGIKSMLTEKTGEQYLRDLIRITAEVAGDQQYQLRTRYSAFLLKYPGKPWATDWFKGFASMAEGAVTSAVEEASLGVSSFQTNHLIAAGLGTYCGTVARKMTQAVFLSEFDAP